MLFSKKTFRTIKGPEGPCEIVNVGLIVFEANATDKTTKAAIKVQSAGLMLYLATLDTNEPVPLRLSLGRAEQYEFREGSGGQETVAVGPPPSDQSAFAAFFGSLEDAGMDPEILASADHADEDGQPYPDFAGLVGLKLDLYQFEKPPFSAGGKPYNQTMVKAILTDEGYAKAVKGAKKPHGAGKTTATPATTTKPGPKTKPVPAPAPEPEPAEDEGDEDAELAAAINEGVKTLLAENDGKISFSALPKLLMPVLKKEGYEKDSISAIVTASADADIVDKAAEVDGEWKREGNTIKVVSAEPAPPVKSVKSVIRKK